MTDITDLTPRTYHERSRIRSAIRLWVAVSGLCAILAAVPVGLESTRQPDRNNALTRERMAQAQTRHTQSQTAIKTITAKLMQQERALQAQDHLTRRPDWSAVIARVAGQFQDNAVMVGFRLDKASNSSVRTSLGAIAPDVAEDSVWLVVSGVAEANSDVPGLILRLESLGLFERIVMTRTGRENYAGVPRTGFVLACKVQ